MGAAARRRGRLRRGRRRLRMQIGELAPVQVLLVVEPDVMVVIVVVIVLLVVLVMLVVVFLLLPQVVQELARPAPGGRPLLVVRNGLSFSSIEA